MIVLPARWKDSIRKEGEKSYPNECCGILLGRIEDDGSRVVEDLIPTENAWAPGEQYHRFQIEPEDMRNYHGAYYFDTHGAAEFYG
jgi:proteasome lid subunit RPN8/RPN11